MVFKDKVVKISSNYQNDAALSITDIYVLDIYQLASQLFTEDVVKSMEISEILKAVIFIEKYKNTITTFIIIESNVFILVFSESKNRFRSK